MTQRIVVGNAKSIVDQIQLKTLDAGIDSLIINMPIYIPGVISEAGEALRLLVGL